MCGIVGIVDFENKPIDRDILIKMSRVLAHRGPDDEGFLIENNMALGHQRLSIIDLSKSGHQPMSYHHCTLIYNGEIYNYLELKEELIRKGYQFKTKTDTEVILASYQEWGVECLNKFNGMWAFALYDRRQDLLFCSRDRMGVKPLYYYFDKNKFLFASEIKAILKHPEVRAKPNDRIIWDFLICGGLVDHSENTFFEGIKELRGGYYLILKKKKLTIHKYWDLDPKKKINFEYQSEYIKKFQALFNEAIKIRLRSDVPIGTCLSGGLDSSAIACVINNFLKKEGKIRQIGYWQKTFSAVYRDKKYGEIDESKFIKAVISKIKAKPHYCWPDGNKIVKELRTLIWHQDYPIASTSIYAQWNVFKLVKKNKIKVMLDGQGADELLAGYHQFFGIYFGQLLIEGKILKLISELKAYSKYHEKSIWLVSKELLIDVIRKGVLGNFVTNIFKSQFRELSLFAPKWRYKYQPPIMMTPAKNNFQNALHRGLKIGLSSLLRYEDRDSMAFSIESRTPFLDYRLVEYLYALPDDQKIAHGQTKWVMRQALEGILPEKVRTRQDKIGFATPEEIWMKEKLGEDMKKVFTSKSFNERGYFVPGKTGEMFEEYLKGKITNYQLFWRLYCLEIWFRVFID